MYLYLALLLLPVCLAELINNGYYPEEIDMPVYCPKPVFKRKSALQWPWVTFNEADRYWYVCADGLKAGYAWGQYHCCEVTPLKNGQCIGNCVNRAKRSLTDNSRRSVPAEDPSSKWQESVPQAAGSPQETLGNRPLNFDNDKLEKMLEDIRKKRMLQDHLNSPSLDSNFANKEKFN